jgi:drug/metabolite transporter (DMT)-like permease
MVLIWGANYSLIKRAFAEVPAQAFNALRLVIASLLFGAAIFWARWRAAARPDAPASPAFYSPQPLNARDWRDLVWLGFIGHFVYQYCFVGGVALTSVANAALIIGSAPVVITIVTAVRGREPISRLHWLGVAISAAGLYLVVGRGASFAGATVRGDLLVVVSVMCWALYTLGATRLLQRHSPLFVTGATMTIGAVPYVILMAPRVWAVDWHAVSAMTRWSIGISAVFALCVSYLIWYAAVQRIGPSRTAVFANLVPITAMTIAAVWLREPVTPARLAGAIAVLGGVFLTRLGRQAPAMPIEE